MAELDYDINQDELENSFECVPAGEYIVIIENSDIVETKSGSGEILKLVHQIIDGPLKGRKIFENLNIKNVNKQAEEISRKKLNSIGVAVGINHIQDSAQLHNIPFKIDVIVKDSEEYGKQNIVRKHSPINGNKIKQEEISSNNNKKPWER